MLDEQKDNLPEADGKKEELKEVNSEETKASNKEAEKQILESDNDPLNEIDESNAEDAEDEAVNERHTIPMPDYHAMSMEKLIEELEKLVKNEKVQAIKTHVDNIKHEFDAKFQELLEQKKDDFINDGGNEIDFRYTSPLKTRFYKSYSEYKEKRNQYYKNLEKSLKENLSNRLAIIEELKGLINVEENINTTYKHFKELQERWYNAGSVPKVNYNDLWRTYHHHVEIFYDFLDLNRELRDLDFKHNLEEKEKIITKAEALIEEEDIPKAFRELQILHKIWKEEIGPVDREHREDVWNRFSNATKAIHDKRQEYYKNIDAVYEANLVKKQEVIAQIDAITSKPVNTHSEWQNQIKKIEALREAFFNIGKVPRKESNTNWSRFKEAVRAFNRNKNAFYKNLKKEQQKNYEKKLELVEIAEANKDNEDWETATEIYKKIQQDWKKIGHVPRKLSDEIWKRFKEACNHYFDRLHAQRNKSSEEELEAYNNKKAFIETLKDVELSGDKETDMAMLQEHIANWKTMGKVPYHKRAIENTFYDTLDKLFKKLGLDKKEATLIKYNNKLEQLANSNNERAIENEKVFIKRKIEELKAKVRQFENNMQFFSNTSNDNPMLKDVVNTIEQHKESLALWKAKLKQLKSMD
ncbi:DUF349 domain-containing protein [Leptobacterium sp. I13]|uniref:DUF349 domain-containing protein n=1 Tax=Leptobacterium meishanense TaxID=3128904 RepID=UPI0030ECD732